VQTNKGAISGSEIHVDDLNFIKSSGPAESKLPIDFFAIN
jgi:hypothetical protein